MEVMKAMLERRSCRGYKADPVPEDCLVAAQGAADSCPVGAISIS